MTIARHPVPRPGSRRAARLVLLLAAGLVAVAALPRAGVAQTGEEPVQLTLEDALNRAERNNPGYRQAVNDLALNRIDRSDAWLQLLPSPQVTALSTNLSWNLQTLGTDEWGNPVENPTPSMVRSSSSAQRVGVAFSLNLQDFVNLRQQSTQATVREISTVVQRRQLRADIAHAFLDVQERRATLDLEEVLLDMARGTLEVTRQAYQLGRRDRMDLISAELDLLDLEDQVTNARVDLDNAYRSLGVLIADPTLGAFEVAPEEIEVFDPSGLDDDAFVAEAIEFGPTMEQARAQVLNAARGISMNRARWLPIVSVSMNSARQEFDLMGGGAFLVPNPEGSWSRNVGVTLTFPDLGQYWNIRNGTNRARVQHRNQEEALRESRLAVEQDVRNLMNELRRAERALEQQTRRAELAEVRRELQVQAYQLGRRTFLELQSASDQAAQARRAELQARYAFERARINLERAIGRLLTSTERDG